MSFLTRLKTERFIRALADIVLINGALLLALMTYYIYVIVYYGDISTAQSLFSEFLASHWLRSAVVTTLCLAAFTASGFYTYGRAYQSKYKTAMIFQAVSLAFLGYTFLTYLLPVSYFLPRSLLLLEWSFTFSAILGARMWSSVWRNLIQTERNVLGQRYVPTTVKHVLVIGGAGYIGSSLIERMLKNGYRVRLLDQLVYGDEAIRTFRDHHRFELIQSDFREIHSVVQAMDGMDAVIHLGAIVGDPACALDEDLTIEINLMATRMIAEVAKAARVNRFIFASTCSVYGASDDILNEQSVLNPVSLYAKSKIASERVLQNMADDEFSPVCLRFGTIYGLSFRTRFDLVVNLLAAKAAVEGKITVFGGDQWRPFVHVQDAALAVFKALEAPLASVRNEVFNVGSDNQNYTIAQIGELVQEAVPNAELLMSHGDGDKRNYQVSFEKIQRVLAFKPEWTVPQGIEQVLESIRLGEVTDYQDARYNNAKYLSEASAYQLDKEGRWALDLINDIQGSDVAH